MHMPHPFHSKKFCAAESSCYSVRIVKKIKRKKKMIIYNKKRYHSYNQFDTCAFDFFGGGVLVLKRATNKLSANSTMCKITVGTDPS